jgi:DNA-directed RNA polymerase sigma subunit (sigma70/sigma32)
MAKEGFPEDIPNTNPENDPAARLEKKDDIGDLVENFYLLNDQEREIICALYGLEGQPTELISEIARRKGITKERVRQHKDRAFKKLRGIEIYKEIARHFDILDEKEKLVVTLLYGLNGESMKSEAEITTITKIPKETVRHIKARAILKLKEVVPGIEE